MPDKLLAERVKLMELNLESIKQVNRSAYHRDEILFTGKPLQLLTGSHTKTLAPQHLAVIPSHIDYQLQLAPHAGQLRSHQCFAYILSLGEGYQSLIEENFLPLSGHEDFFDDLALSSIPNPQWLMVSNILFEFSHQQKAQKTLANKKLRFHFASILYLTAFQAIYEATPPEDSALRERRRMAWQLRDYVDHHYLEPLDLASVAREFSISTSTVNRRFKEFYHDTLYNYLIQQRLKHAHHLIAQGHNITESWQAAGFRDYSNFYRSFIQVYGYLPHEAKKKGGWEISRPK